MRKINKKLQRIKVTEQDFKNFDKIVSIPKNLNKSMVLYLQHGKKRQMIHNKLIL